MNAHPDSGAQPWQMKLPRRPFLSSRSRSWIPYGVLAGALIVTFLAALYVHRTAQAKDRTRFENSVKQINTILDSRLDTYVALLRAGVGLFAASVSVEPDEFHKFVEGLETRSYIWNPSIAGTRLRSATTCLLSRRAAPRWNMPATPVRRRLQGR